MADLPCGTVTFLFSDIEGSTRLLAELRDRYADVLADHRRVLRAAFDEGGGLEVGTEGDAFFVAFASARDAVAAAVAGQRRLASSPWPEGHEVRVRMGLHSGEAAVRGGDYVGLDVHRAARICAAAHGGQVLVSRSTRELVAAALTGDVALRDLGEHRLKDLDQPEHLFQVVAGGLRLEFPPLSALSSGFTGAGALPPTPNRTIGRSGDIGAIVAQLHTGSTRLLTLTGPGGVGKTRVAVEAARMLREEFDGGARFVSLAALRRADQVPAALIQQLAIAPMAGETAQQSVARVLSSKPLLLVLDNLEHLVPEVADVVAELQACCPALTVLATSRAPLRLAGEQCRPLRPLGLPAQDARVDPSAPPPAVELFIERARARDPAFELDEHNRAPIIEICRHVDGLPLAIELAAARCAVLSPAEIADRLATASALGDGTRDAPARQRTLRATIDWSYRLLNDAERQTFARFAVFTGGATVSAVEDIIEAALDTLDGLVTKSLLVRRTQDASTRLTMLETIREYAAERLADSDEHRAIRERHFRHFLALARRHGDEKAIMGTGHREHLRRLDGDVDNLHAALAWAIEERDAERALSLVAALGRYWLMRSRFADALRWTDAALALPGANAHPELRVRALWTRMFSLRPMGHGLELPAAQEAEAIARALGDPLLLSEALRVHADRENIANRAHIAEAYVDEASALAATAGDPWAIAEAAHTKAGSAATIDELRERVERAASLLEQAGNVNGLADLLTTASYVALNLDSIQDARALSERAVAIAKELDGPFIWMIVQGNVGLAAILDGDAERARRAFREELMLSRELVIPLVASEGLRGLAAVAVSQGDLPRAARLVGAAATHTYERLDGDAVQSRLDTAVFQPARRHHGEAAWDAASREGAALSLRDALAYALEEPGSPYQTPCG